MKFLKFILTFTLFCFAYLGDYIVFKSKYSDSQVFRAFTDSLVHGAIGFLSSALFFSHKLNVSTQNCVVSMIICTFVSSAIDIDHVFVANSLQIKDVLTANRRGVFHCTTFWILIVSILYAYSFIKKKVSICIFTYMLLLAFSSHHIRDASRRGLWVYPYGHTPPINRHIYIFLISVLPNIFAFVYLMKRDYFKEIVEYTTV